MVAKFLFHPRFKVSAFFLMSLILLEGSPSPIFCRWCAFLGSDPAVKLAGLLKLFMKA